MFLNDTSPMAVDVRLAVKDSLIEQQKTGRKVDWVGASEQRAVQGGCMFLIEELIKRLLK